MTANHTEAACKTAIERSLLMRGGYKKLVLDRFNFRISQMDALIESIALLSEYRTALISSAVTGKIDIRNLMENSNGD